jgi:hypothetical protein
MTPVAPVAPQYNPLEGGGGGSWHHWPLWGCWCAATTTTGAVSGNDSDPIGVEVIPGRPGAESPVSLAFGHCGGAGKAVPNGFWFHSGSIRKGFCKLCRAVRRVSIF